MGSSHRSSGSGGHKQSKFKDADASRRKHASDSSRSSKRKQDTTDAESQSSEEGFPWQPSGRGTSSRSEVYNSDDSDFAVEDAGNFDSESQSMDCGSSESDSRLGRRSWAGTGSSKKIHTTSKHSKAKRLALLDEETASMES